MRFCFFPDDLKQHEIQRSAPKNYDQKALPPYFGGRALENAGNNKKPNLLLQDIYGVNVCFLPSCFHTDCMPAEFARYIAFSAASC